MRRAVLGLLMFLSGPVTALAAAGSPSTEAPAAEAAAMETVVVTGVQPGPGLWKVSKGEHVLWVLGTLSPLPKKFEWRAQEVEAAVAASQELLTAPALKMGADIGFFGQLALMPSLIGLRNNPDGAKLSEVLPPDLYARWSVLKEKYIGRSGKVEKWRPIFAALELYDDAIEKTGLDNRQRAQKTVLAAARKARVKTTAVEVVVALDDPRAAIKEFKHASLDDLECFRKTLDRIDTDLGTMAARANAWATGDLDALRQLPYTDQMTACLAAVNEMSLFRSRGITDIDARIEKAWLDAASAALEKNAVSFAMLSIRHLLEPDNYLAKLRAQGYTVEAPDAEPEPAEAAPAVPIGSP